MERDFVEKKQKELDKKPLVIFDTDMDTDCDDAGALAILYEYVKRGKAELLGIVTDTVSPYSAGCCEALGDFYGVKCPIGTVYASQYPATETNRLVRYRAHSASMGVCQYNHIFANQVGKRDTDFPSAVSVYRKLLSSVPDKSVIIVCVGLLTALDELLLSQGDEISPLSGKELLEQKASKVISMGYPQKEGDNFNWEMDGEGANRFFENCPVSVFVSGSGEDVITGSVLSKRLPSTHPLRQIYERFNGVGVGRASWDLIATLYAVEPNSPYLRAVERGQCRYDEKKSRSYWAVNGERKDYEIELNCPKEELVAYLDKRMLGDF